MANKRQGLVIINSIKHFTPYTVATTASGAIRNVTLASAVAKGATRTAVSSVEEGCKIFGSYIELWINGIGSATNETQFIVVLVLLKSGAAAPTASDMLNLQAYENKKNILYTTQGVIGSVGNQSIPLMRERYQVPKGKQRFGLGDSLNLVIATVGASVKTCGIAVFKEFE